MRMERLGVFGLACASLLAACGGGGGGGNGTATTTLSDPAPCTNQFSHVFVTVQDVQAHTSPDADSGFTDLTPQLRTNPKQIDLMDLAAGECTLATLGDKVGLAAGKYQQIRLQLLPNKAPDMGVAAPSPNNCASLGANVFNCVQPASGSLAELTTPSASIKIPPGQLAQGGLTVPAGQAVDIDIDFNACTSVVKAGNSGKFLLKPTLRAGELGTNPLVSGTLVVGMVSGTSVTPGATVVPNANVWLEQQSASVAVAGATTTTETVENFVQATQSGADGKFAFCPVMAGSYEIVADAMTMPDGAAPSNATIAGGVSVASSGGPNNLVIPLVSDSSGSTPATLSGQISTANMASTSGDAISFAAAQGFSSSGNQIQALVPFFQIADSSGTLMATASPGVTMTAATPGTNCPTGNACPTGSNCACYTGTVPPSNPVIGAANSDGSGYAAPAAPPTNGAVTAGATSETTGEDVCNPAALITPEFAWSPTGTTSVSPLDFMNCD